MGTNAEVRAKGSFEGVEVRTSLVLEWLVLTLCGSATGWGCEMTFSSHAASLGVDAIVSASVRALGCVSMSRILARIRPTGRWRDPGSAEVL